jgi:hypothetical protein
VLANRVQEFFNDWAAAWCSENTTSVPSLCPSLFFIAMSSATLAGNGGGQETKGGMVNSPR